MDLTDLVELANYLHICAALFADYFCSILSNIGMKDCARAKENTSFGPVVSNLGVRPLKKAVKPSFLKVFLTMVNPLCGLSKFLF